MEIRSAGVTYPQTCSKSPYKDDRHDWSLLMYEDHPLMAVNINSRPPCYHLIRCVNCNLLVLFLQDGKNGGNIPRNSDQIIHAFYEVRA